MNICVHNSSHLSRKSLRILRISLSQLFCTFILFSSLSVAQTPEEDAHRFEEIVASYRQTKDFIYNLGYMNENFLGSTGNPRKYPNLLSSSQANAIELLALRAHAIHEEYHRELIENRGNRIRYAEILSKYHLSISKLQKVASRNYNELYDEILRFSLKKQIFYGVGHHYREYEIAQKKYIDYLIDHDFAEVEKQTDFGYIEVSAVLKTVAKSLLYKYRMLLEHISQMESNEEIDEVELVDQVIRDYFPNLNIETVSRASEYNFDILDTKAAEIREAGGTEYIQEDTDIRSPVEQLKYELYTSIGNVDTFSMIVRSHSIEQLNLAGQQILPTGEHEIYELNRDVYNYEMSKRNLEYIIDAAMRSKMLAREDGSFDFEAFGNIIGEIIEERRLADYNSASHLFDLPGFLELVGLKLSDTGTIRIGSNKYEVATPINTKFGPQYEKEQESSELVSGLRESYLEHRRKARDLIILISSEEKWHSNVHISSRLETTDIAERTISLMDERLLYIEEIRDAVNAYYKSLYELYYLDPYAASWRIDFADVEVQMPRGIYSTDHVRGISLQQSNAIARMDEYGNILGPVEQEEITPAVIRLVKTLQQTSSDSDVPAISESSDQELASLPDRTQSDFGFTEAIASALRQSLDPEQPVDGAVGFQDSVWNIFGNVLTSSADAVYDTDSSDTDSSDTDQPIGSAGEEGQVEGLVTREIVEELRQEGIEARFSPDGAQIDAVTGASIPRSPSEDQAIRDMRRWALDIERSGIHRYGGHRYGGINVADQAIHAINNNYYDYFDTHLRRSWQRLMLSPYEYLQMRDSSGKKVEPKDLKVVKKISEDYQSKLSRLIYTFRSRVQYSPDYAGFVKEIEVLPSAYSEGSYFAFASPNSLQAQWRMTPDFPADFQPGTALVLGHPMIVDHSPVGLGKALYEASDFNEGNNELVMFEILPARHGSQRLLNQQLKEGLDPSPELTGAGAVGSGPSERYGMARYLGNALVGDALATAPSTEMSSIEETRPFYQSIATLPYQAELEEIPIGIYAPEGREFLSFMQFDKSIFVPGTAFYVHNIQSDKAMLHLKDRRQKAMRDVREPPTIELLINLKVVQLRVRESITQGSNVHLIQKGDNRLARDTLINVNDLESLGLKPSFRITETCQ